MRQYRKIAIVGTFKSPATLQHQSLRLDDDTIDTRDTITVTKV